MTIVRWEPLRELGSLQNEMNRLFNTVFDAPQPGNARDAPLDAGHGPRRDRRPLRPAGRSPRPLEEDIKIEFEDGTLTVSGERKAEHESKNEGYYRVERAFGAFSRSLTLPQGIDPEAVAANFDRGVLEIRVPKPEERKPRRIEIGGGGAADDRGLESTSARPSPRHGPPGPARVHAVPVFDIRTRDPATRARTGTLNLAHGGVRTPAFVPLATKAVVKTLEVREAAELGFDMVLGNTFHLFLSPGHELIARLGGLHRFMRWDRPVITDSGGFQVFSMGHGTVADEIKGRAAQAAAAGERSGAILKIEEKGVTFRSYLDGSTRFMGPETSMEVQAALGADIALVFDECTPFHGGRDYTARSTERTHRWLDRCLAWHAEHGPTGQLVYGIVQGGVEEDLRRASAQEVAARPVGGIAIGGTLGQDKEQMFEVVEWTVQELDEDAPAPPARHRRDRRPGARRRARHGHVRLRDADPHRAPRHGGGPRPRQPLASRSRQGPLPHRRRAGSRRLPVPGLRPRLQPRLPALPAQGARADRPAAPDDPQPRLPAGADGRAARRDRRGPAGRGRSRRARRCGPWELA